MTKLQGRTILEAQGFRTTADVDAWRERPETWLSTGGIMSRFAALKHFIGEEAASWLLHDLSIDTAKLPARGK